MILTIGLWSLLLAGRPALAIENGLQTRLGSAFSWLLDNPPLPWEEDARRPSFALIDSVAWLLSNTDWNSYKSSWSDSAAADAMEDEHPILYYYRMAMDHAIDEIINTTVTHGVVVWQMYNVGTVVKTPAHAFACDLNFRGAERLVEVLDFTSVSHEHGDHFHTGFLNAMVEAGKPVYSPYWNSGTILEGGEVITVGELTIKFRMSAQGDLPCILTQVDCGPSGLHYTIYHSGDANHAEDFVSDDSIHLFVPHSNVGLDIQTASRQLQPRIVLLSHYMELGHAVGNYRWSYGGNGLSDVRKYNNFAAGNNYDDTGICMTWGERLDPRGNLDAGMTGCMDAGALNYDSLATVACDSCCEYSASVLRPAVGDISITPNTVLVNRRGPHSVHMLNVNGKTVLFQSANGTAGYGLSALLPGVHVVKVRAGEEEIIRKVMILP